ncbi:MAG TPA: 6-phosphogluconolactonase [Rhabdochlamydiaceae bacterium]|nr:6-phosphogluconolactonase [Rhabdochlamydiaceae bacterium]
MMNAELLVPGDYDATLHFSVEHFINTCRDAIQDHGQFFVALSGGSTPKALYELLCQPQYSEEIEWSKIHLFWSDERSVPPTHEGSNYRMAMKAGFEKMLLLPEHIHRMEAEEEIDKNALKYEKKIVKILNGQSFDLVMLGMGEDGHTASLFPQTDALHAKGRLVVANHVPQKETWRMTLTFDCINDAAHTVFYVLGQSKAEMMARVFSEKAVLPCQKVGTPDNPALWIADQAAASLIPNI